MGSFIYLLMLLEKLIDHQANDFDVNPTKMTLKNLHDSHLSIYGSSTKQQQHAIIDELGGADQILTALLESNAFFDDKTLKSLHHIINNSQNYNQSRSDES